jgi:fumarylacetoacetase
MELTRNGAELIELPSGETRAFLEDGDEVALSAFAVAPGRARIGFGECRARVLPAPAA